MKLTLEFDTDNPTQNRLLRQLLDAMSPTATTVEQPVTSPTAPVPPAPQSPVPSATPLSDLRAELTALFNKLYAEKPDDAMRVGEQCRAEFGADNNSWTQEQWKTALSRIQAYITF